MRRGGRVVECGGLENRFTGNPGDEGSNPSFSASFSCSNGMQLARVVAKWSGIRTLRRRNCPVGSFGSSGARPPRVRRRRRRVESLLLRQKQRSAPPSAGRFLLRDAVRCPRASDDTTQQDASRGTAASSTLSQRVTLLKPPRRTVARSDYSRRGVLRCRMFHVKHSYVEKQEADGPGARLRLPWSFLYASRPRVPSGTRGLLFLRRLGYC